MADPRRDRASDRDGGDVFMEYGLGGRSIDFSAMQDKGVAEGKAVSDEEIGKAGSGAPVSPDSR